jgi:hypothetical protein
MLSISGDYTPRTPPRFEKVLFVAKPLPALVWGLRAAQQVPRYTMMC